MASSAEEPSVPSFQQLQPGASIAWPINVADLVTPCPR